MRTKYQLWKVSNGWLLVPEGRDGQIVATDAPLCSVFKSLKEFADFKPKRERKSRARKTIKANDWREMPDESQRLPGPAPQHTKD